MSPQTEEHTDTSRHLLSANKPDRSLTKCENALKTCQHWQPWGPFGRFLSGVLQPADGWQALTSGVRLGCPGFAWARGTASGHLPQGHRH